jgi:methyltransferase-like protein/tRNA1(Val) A37 N6-methylase TrmN6
MENSYDEIPYESHAFAQTHPDRLAVMATLFGLSPRPVTSCRVLELGCAAGGNLIPMAWHLPQSTFVGLDLSSRQVRDGCEVIEKLGLANVQLHTMDITQVDQRLGRFDYILCHGVYSWVPEPVQQAILRICRELLEPEGVAYISYNTYPGWRMRQMIRDMMLYHARQFDTPQRQLDGARTLIAFLNAHVAKDNAYGLLLDQELAILEESGDYYLLHDHMEKINLPCYFHEFIERAGGQGLAYLGEADLGSMLVETFPDEVKRQLSLLSSDRVHLEQYLDFLHNRQFRQTLLAHPQALRMQAPQPLQLRHLLICAELDRENVNDAIAGNAPVRFVASNGVVVTSADPLVKAALVVLAESFPSSMGLDVLYRAALEHLGKQPEPSREAANLRILGEALLEFHGAGAVELHSYEGYPFSTGQDTSDTPRVTALARVYAQRSIMVPGRWHEAVNLGLLGQRALLLMDGRHSVEQVKQGLLEAVRQDELGLTDSEGREVHDPAEQGELLDAFLQDLMGTFRRHGFLMTQQG